jgi:hypothetical protein
MAGCGWTASSNASWLTIASGAPATGTGTVKYSAPANTTGTPRTATLTIAGKTVTITEAPSSVRVPIPQRVRIVGD